MRSATKSGWEEGWGGQMGGVRVPLSNSGSSNSLGMWVMGGAFSEWGSSLKASYSRIKVGQKSYIERFLSVYICSYLRVYKVTHAWTFAGKICAICENAAFYVGAKHMLRCVWTVTLGK